MEGSSTISLDSTPPTCWLLRAVDLGQTNMMMYDCIHVNVCALSFGEESITNKFVFPRCP